MFNLRQESLTNNEQALLRRLKVWVAGLAAACLLAGVGVGALLAGRPSRAVEPPAIDALSASFAEVAQRVEPAVVNIDTVEAAPETAAKDGEGDPKTPRNPLFDMMRRRPAKSVGSGFIVDPQGFLVTNEHVVKGATRITVRMQDGTEYRGEVVGTDPETDLAVVKIKAEREFTHVKFGDSNQAAVGDWVLAIGSPFGLDQTVTAGIISKKERQTAGGSNFQRFIQTDAAINRGNSGGPLVNMRGEVIGVNSQIATSTGDYNGIGFALPSNEARFVYEQIIANSGKVRRGYLGIFLESVKPEYAKVYGLPKAEGAIVTDVKDTDGPAAKAGLQPNDVIIEFNGQPVISSLDLISKVASTPVGSAIKVGYLRETGGKPERRDTTVTLGERPADLAPRDNDEPAPKKDNPPAPENSKVKLGLTLEELTSNAATRRPRSDDLKGVKGLLVKDVAQDGILADISPSLRSGDIITRVNRKPVATLDEFQKAIDALKPGDALVFNVLSPDTGSRYLQRIVQLTYQ
jgi:serine protease Do